MVKKCNLKYKGKCFKTKRARNRYKSWNSAIKIYKKDKFIPKSLIKKFSESRDSYIGK